MYALQPREHVAADGWAGAHRLTLLWGGLGLCAGAAVHIVAQTVPIDYNAWLVFRGLVDFVLLNDFSTYVMFALAFAELPTAFSWLEVLRYSAGLALIVFNWFIKIDALRVVKDYAWCRSRHGVPSPFPAGWWWWWWGSTLTCVCESMAVGLPSLFTDWGDFFFLVDGTLTFDGVFQMAPHPMYSIGYVRASKRAQLGPSLRPARLRRRHACSPHGATGKAAHPCLRPPADGADPNGLGGIRYIGFYGVSLMSRSYTVLYVSLAAHLCQFLFLGYVENPRT